MSTESDRNLSIQQKNAIDLLIVGQGDEDSLTPISESPPCGFLYNPSRSSGYFTGIQHL